MECSFNLLINVTTMWLSHNNNFISPDWGIIFSLLWLNLSMRLDLTWPKISFVSHSFNFISRNCDFVSHSETLWPYISNCDFISLLLTKKLDIMQRYLIYHNWDFSSLRLYRNIRMAFIINWKVAWEGWNKTWERWRTTALWWGGQETDSELMGKKL